MVRGKSNMQKQARFASKADKNAKRKNAIKKKKNLSMKQSQGTTGTITTSLSGLSGKAVRGLRHRGSDAGITKKQANKYQPTGGELMTVIKELATSTTTTNVNPNKKKSTTADERKIEKMEERTRVILARQQERLVGRKKEQVGGGEKVVV